MPKQEEVKYTRTHEWIFVQGQEAVVGLSDHAQHEMGDIVFVELVDAGAVVQDDVGVEDEELRIRCRFRHGLRPVLPPAGRPGPAPAARPLRR